MTSRRRTLVFHPALATYRIDLFNRLAEALDIRFVFTERQLHYHPELNTPKLEAQLRCDFGYLKGNIRILGSDIRIGIRKEIEAFHPDVVVTHEFSHLTFSVMVLKALSKTRPFGIVTWTADSESLWHRRSLIRRTLACHGIRQTDSVLVYSDAVAKRMARKTGSDLSKFFICANLQDEKKMRSEVARSLFFSKQYLEEYQLVGKRVLLSIGRLVARKNIGAVIYAFSKVAKTDPSAMLVIVGNGILLPWLKKLATIYGISDRVVFTGHLESQALYGWIPLATGLILASTDEPYGAVVNEALLSGVPVLCSSAAGASVLIEPGKNGEIFDPSDMVKLQCDMQRLLADTPLLSDSLKGLPHESRMPVLFERDVNGFKGAVDSAWDKAALR